MALFRSMLCHVQKDVALVSVIANVTVDLQEVQPQLNPTISQIGRALV
ncbi:hypothetical protein [uncultured Ruegeria sp.]|nr:hypothetical protein [uncultured Ruegeria sp.]